MKYRYDSNDDILNELFKPCINNSKELMFCTAYFSSQMLIELFEEISKLLERGSFKLIIGSETDIEELALLQELELKDIGEHIFSKLFEGFSVEEIDKLEIYSRCLKEGNFEIKIGKSTRGGTFHDKFYIFEPKEEGSFPIAAHGSLNFTKSGFHSNYESLNIKESEETYEYSKEDFSKLWKNSMGGTNVEAIKNVVIDLVDKKIFTTYKMSPRLKMKDNLRDYQQEAIQKVIDNDYCGILKMATGTGKTFTAMGLINKYLFEDKISKKVIISVPYKHLAEQWTEEVSEFFGSELKTIIIHSDNKKADQEFRKYYKNPIIEHCFIFVNDSFKKYIDNGYIVKMNNPLLIIDEVHNLTKNFILDTLEINNFIHTIGLSATPEDEFDETRTECLFEYFKGVVYEYSLEKAIENNYLTNYYYYPKRVDLDEEEAKEYEYLETKLKNGNSRLETMDEIDKLLSHSSRKLIEFKKDFENYSNKNEKLSHTIVYCSPGTDRRLTNEKYINIVSEELHQINKNVKIKKFTSEESTQERNIMTKEFENKEIEILLAIKCLDEGYNVPAIKTAFLLQSGNRERQHIQRRGRLLRNYEDKEFSEIYDYVVYNNGKIIPSELKRLEEYSKLATNKIDLKEWSVDE